MRSSSFVSYKSEAKATKGSGEVFDLKKLSKSMDVLSKKVQELGEKRLVQSAEFVCVHPYLYLRLVACFSLFLLNEVCIYFV